MIGRVLVIVGVLSCATARAEVDGLGDPLPEGAVARLGTHRLRFGSFYRMSFSPDGKILAGSHQGMTILLDPRTGKEIRRFHTGYRGCYGHAFHPDGKHIFAGAKMAPPVFSPIPTPVGMWEIKTGKLVRRFPEKGGDGAWEVSLSDDGKRLAVQTREDKAAILIWDVETGKLIREFDADKNSPYTVCLSPDG